MSFDLKVLKRSFKIKKIKKFELKTKFLFSYLINFNFGNSSQVKFDVKI